MKPKFNPPLMHKDFYPFFERIFYRPIAGPLTKLAARLGLGPTRVNILGFLVGTSGIILIAFGDYWLRVAGTGILIVSYILDCVDGMLARGLKRANRFGALLDTTLDSIKESLIFFALAWTYYVQTQNKYIFLYLTAVLFLQRMFGRTLAWYYLLFDQRAEEIKTNALRRLPKIFRFGAWFFSEAYRSGTIWIVVLLGVAVDQIVPTFIYFIVVLSALMLFLMFKAYEYKNKI